MGKRSTSGAPEAGSVEYAGRRIEFSIRRSPRRRTVGLSVTAEAQVVVAAPPWVGRELIDGYVHEKAAWILRHQLRLQSLRQVMQATVREFRQGELLPLLDDQLRLHYDQPCHPLPPQLQRSGPLLVIRGIPETHADEAARQAVVRRLLEGWYREQALDYFRQSAARYSTELGLDPPRVGIGGAASRWGSCNSRGELRFNWRLMLAPSRLADYVAAHEVAHRRELNHSLRFWRIVAGLLPDFKLRQRELDELAGSLQL